MTTSVERDADLHSVLDPLLALSIEGSRWYARAAEHLSGEGTFHLFQRRAREHAETARRLVLLGASQVEPSGTTPDETWLDPWMTEANEPNIVLASTAHEDAVIRRYVHALEDQTLPDYVCAELQARAAQAHCAREELRRLDTTEAR